MCGSASPEAPCGDTIPRRLRSLADEASERVCCHFVSDERTQEIDYRDLMANADAFATALAERKIRRGEIVVIALRHTPEMFACHLGSVISGVLPAFVAPVANRQNFAIYEQGLRHLVDRHAIRAVVVDAQDAEMLARISGLDPSIFVAPPAWSSPASATTSAAEASIDADDGAILQFSSGTTGHRKGVLLTHRMVLRQLDSLSAALALGSGDRIFSWLPLYHDMGLMAGYLLPLLRGIPLVIMDPFTWVNAPSHMFALVEKHRCTHAWMPNFAFSHLVRTVRPQEHYDLSSMRAWINCSEPCRATTADAFIERFQPLGVAGDRMLNCYAMAETVFAVTQTPTGQPPRRLRATIEDDRVRAAAGEAEGRTLLSVGMPIAGISCRIVGAHGEALADGTIGEIVVSGDFVCDSYYRNPRESQATFRNGEYFTGDTGFIRDGDLFVLGRKKDLIIVNGRNFYAHDIEESACRASGTKPGRVIAIGVDNEESGSQDLVILVETAATDVAERKQLQREVKLCVEQSLGVLPAKVVAVAPGWLAKTTSGKPDRTRNRQRFLERNT